MHGGGEHSGLLLCPSYLRKTRGLGLVPGDRAGVAGEKHVAITPGEDIHWRTLDGEPPVTTARRTHGFRESVIRGMSRLAREHGAINLAQGFPNFPAPDLLKEAAARAIHDDINQYAITWGAQRLRDALG